MKKEYLISWSSFIEIFGRESGFDADKWSKMIVQQYLLSIYNVQSTLTIGNNCLDIIADVDGHRVGIEVKDRYKKSTDFGDQIIEKAKFDSIRKKIDKGYVEQAVLFNIFADGVITYENCIEKPERIKRITTEFCPRTTTLGDTEMVKKVLVHYKQHYKSDFKIKVIIDDNGNYTAECVFSNIRDTEKPVKPVNSSVELF